jgi:Uma2 family endonuclease
MSAIKTNLDSNSAADELTRAIALPFSAQSIWSEEEYLALDAGRLVEFDNGHVEILPTPSRSHQRLVLLFARLLETFLQQAFPGAIVMIAPHPVKLWAGKFREPDVFVVLPAHADRSHEAYCEQPDLVVEIVSPEYRKHDWDIKRREYAQAGIPEYWIVDLQAKTVTVLKLAGKSYRVHGTYGRGETAESALLKGFQVNVDDIWRAASGAAPAQKVKKA